MTSTENEPQPPPPRRRKISVFRWVLYGFLVLVAAAFAVPNFVKSRETACKNACINNLRQIDGAKEQWALENQLPAGAPPDQNAIALFIKGGWPACPGGGTYTPEAIGLPPRCTMGHTL